MPLGSRDRAAGAKPCRSRSWPYFGQLEQFPRGLLPFDDAICRFNPVWGQGMSVAAQEADLLRRLLASDGEPLPNLARHFFAGTAGLIETPRALAAVPDFAFPPTEGQRPDDLDRILAFNNGLLRLAADNPAVHKLVRDVQHLSDRAASCRIRTWSSASARW